MSKTSVILLCAGSSKKMKGHGTRSLLPIKGKSLIEWQVNLLSQISNDIVCVLGFQAEKLYRYSRNMGLRYVFNDSFDDSSSYKSVLYGLRSCRYNKILIVHGDLFITKQSLPSMQYSSLLLNNNQSNEVGALIEQGKIYRVDYGFNTTWQKVTFLGSKEVKLARELNFDDIDKWKLDFELYNKLIDLGGEFQADFGKTNEINCVGDWNRIK